MTKARAASASGMGESRNASPARRAALDALDRVRNPRAPGLDVLLEEAVTRAEAIPADAALAREIAFGVLRHRFWLESVLARHVQRPFADTAPRVHLALLMGVYQLAHLDRVPVHAIVDETVRLAASQPSGERLKGLVNAVMRRLSQIPRTELRASPEVPWRTRLSAPDAVALEVVETLGEREAEDFFAASNVPAPLCVRERGAESREWAVGKDESVITIGKGQLVPDCVILEGRGLAPDRMEAFREGRITVEDEGAQAACLLAAGKRQARRVLDLCAAPGGKTCHLADLLPDAAITACDVSEPKLAKLRETVERLGLGPRIDIRLARDLLESASDQSYDLILVDAPCSGLGTLRRHPEIRYRRGASDFADLGREQLRILGDVARLVAPGGEIAYSVCTIGTHETTAVAERFLAHEPAFRPAGDFSFLPFDEAGIRIGEGCWRILPQKWGCDGFFVARFKRTHDLG